jgi:hypothetical protein
MKVRRRYALRLFSCVSLVLLSLLPIQAPAAEKTWRIGFLSPAIRDSFHDPFFKGLRELGYIEGPEFHPPAAARCGDSEAAYGSSR